MSKTLRVLIVDDEPLARAHLRQLLAADRDIEVVGECGDGREAVRAIRELNPALVLLDIQIPELDGFGVVREVGVDRMPSVIFVTAYDEYALRAFEVFALAYLLKPVDRQRLAEALTRAKKLTQRGSREDLASRLSALLEHRAEGTENRLAIKVNGRILFVSIDDIDYVEAMDNHVRLHLGQREYVVRATLSALEQRLMPGRFLRIHRSTIVNVKRVQEAQPWFGGDYVLILADGTRLTSGRSYRERVHEFLRRAL